MSIFLKHQTTNQLCKVNRGKLIAIKKVTDAFIIPSQVITTYEVMIIENVSDSYINDLCRENVTLAKKSWTERVSTLINTLMEP